ncbi:MAG: hypothetical protein ACE5JL_16660 [Dehalococcoidia bacterium]
MERFPSILGLPILGGVFVLVVGGVLGIIFSAVGGEATIGIGLAIVVISPIIAGMLVKRKDSS